MLTDDELERFTCAENKVSKTHLHQTYPNKVDINFGLDVNKQKGIQNFPIYNSTDGFKSHAKINLDDIVYDKNFGSKYDVKDSIHTRVPTIKPFYYTTGYEPLPEQTNFRVPLGIMSRLYGLPPDRRMILENHTAEAMKTDGMTEKQFMVKNWRKESSANAGGDANDFINDPRVQNLINGPTPSRTNALGPPSGGPPRPPFTMNAIGPQSYPMDEPGLSDFISPEKFEFMDIEHIEYNPLYTQPSRMDIQPSKADQFKSIQVAPAFASFSHPKVNDEFLIGKKGPVSNRKVPHPNKRGISNDDGELGPIKYNFATSYENNDYKNTFRDDSNSTVKDKAIKRNNKEKLDEELPEKIKKKFLAIADKTEGVKRSGEDNSDSTALVIKKFKEDSDSTALVVSTKTLTGKRGDY